MSEQRSEQFPAEVLMLGLGGILMFVGAFLPWVSVASIFSVSGIDAQWGLVALFAGFAALGVSAQLGTGRLVRAELNRGLSILGVILGVVGLAAALYVGFAIRDTVAEDESGSTTTSEDESTGDAEFDASMEEFEESLEDLFAIKVGTGVYIAIAGGLLTSAGGAVAIRRHSR